MAPGTNPIIFPVSFCFALDSKKSNRVIHYTDVWYVSLEGTFVYRYLVPPFSGVLLQNVGAASNIVPVAVSSGHGTSRVRHWGRHNGIGHRSADIADAR